ncbi:DUF6090 family protein [Geojedonia litorea]|uniref:DUF6090 family protein n=1 Tax=Geojedonia litorea TaxID=1268269 RepID=A0ABV9N0Z4_9FLAO
MENKTGKYFKYAIGEIVLVVVGILIALQLNTWNENRKASNEELKILTALKSDFKVSKDRIEETIKIQSKVMSYSQILINIYERQNKEEYHYFDTHLDSLDYLISYGTSWYRAEPVTGAYNSLISAGKIDLIKNEELRHALAQFSADFESGFEDQETSMHLLNKLNEDVDHFTLKIATNEFRKRYNYNPRKVDSLKISESFFTNDSYFGNLYLKSVLENNRLTRQKQMLEMTNTILSIINQELEH